MVSPGTHPDPMTGTTVWVPERRPVAVDPWDMPYFGATVYLRYQPALSPLPGTRIPVGSTAAVSAPKERVADSGETHRRSWLSRLFGRN
jgi:hypothetical protein